MGSDYEQSFPVVRKLGTISLFAALLAIPMLLCQASDNGPLQVFGEVGSFVIWLYFVVELIILLRIWEDNVEFVRGHLLEVTVVIASSPFFLMAYEAESLFGVAPFLRVVRFVKLAKLGKISKAGKLLHGRDLPQWIVVALWGVLGTAFLGISGMIFDHHAHSFVDGLDYWVGSVRTDFRIEWWTLLPCALCLLVGAFFIHSAHRDRGKADLLSED